MRKWMIAGTVLVFLCVMVVLALLSVNSLINQNRDYLVNRAEQALGRKVSVGKVGVSLWNGIGVRLNDFSLSDDPSFSSGDFIRAKDLQVNLKILPLLSKEIEIKRLILHKPVIAVEIRMAPSISPAWGEQEEKRCHRSLQRTGSLPRKRPHLYPSWLASWTSRTETCTTWTVRREWTCG